MSQVDVQSFGALAVAHLQAIVQANDSVMRQISDRLVADVQAGKSLLVFGSGHSALFPMELYHRAGGASFVIPLVAECLLPTAGPPLVRILERSSGIAPLCLERAEPKAGEMLWIASQSGINHAGVDLAIEAKKRGLFTVAFTSKVHSQAVTPRHPSGKRLFEVCDLTVDLGGRKGDALVPIGGPGHEMQAGPVSTLGSVLLGHSILVDACARLESQGVRCTYTSVNTPEGEARNREIEKQAMKRDPLLRG